MIRTCGAGGSTSLLNGTPSATPSAHSVSTLGFPEPDSRWERVDFATPARLASSDSDRPVRARSRRSERAMISRGADWGGSLILFDSSVWPFCLTNSLGFVHDGGL